jgi:predicted chitinase
MSKISKNDFVNFFKYYNGEDHQKQAVELLYKELDTSLFNNQLYDDSEWVQQYRTPVSRETKAEEPPKWPITKQEMADIMGCSVSSLPDSLMDDFGRCCKIYGMSKLSICYFLGQCGHESGGLRYPVEIHDGSNYEGRSDLGNIYPGDGVTFAGTGWIQVTGRYNHQLFSDYLQKNGEFDKDIMEVGKKHSSEKYPWSISGNWWFNNGMNDFCMVRPEMTDYQIDEIGARVNGRMRPNGADDRLHYTHKAMEVLGFR